MLTVVVWRWGTKYPGHYVERLWLGLKRHFDGARILVVEPQEGDRYLTGIPGCFARLRTFDPVWQKANGILEGERIVVLDLDLIVTGALSPVFDRPEPFVILQGVNAKNPNPYNGSVWMLRAGFRPDVWSDFTLEKAGKVPFYAFPDDQAWFHHMIPGAGAFGPSNGVYAFQKPGWPACDALPKGAKIVAFPGHRDPSQFTNLGWVAEHWK